MSKESFVFILGVVIFFSPFLGFPREYKEWFFIGAGVVLMFLGYRLRRLEFLRSLEDASGERTSDAFVESDNAIPLVEEEKEGSNLRV